MKKLLALQMLGTAAALDAAGTVDTAATAAADDAAAADGAASGGARGAAEGCNSFDPTTPVLMANGTTQAIKDINVIAFHQHTNAAGHAFDHFVFEGDSLGHVKRGRLRQIDTQLSH